MTKIFDVGSSSIASGTTLIEASAGTGKTFAIAGIVVRLIAQRDLPLGRILVVTFTEAATQELRDRVRTRIQEAMVLLEEGRAEGDPALSGFIGADAQEIAVAIRRLKNALLSFDEAAIFTIHGFCQRMLRENAFETGALFDVEVVADALPLWRAAAEDFWRENFYTTDPEIGSLVVSLQDKGRLSPEGLVKLAAQLARHPLLEILADRDSMTLQDCVRSVAQVMAALRREWQQSGPEVDRLLANPAIFKKAVLSPDLLEQVREDLPALGAEPPLPPAVFQHLPVIASEALEKATKVRATPPIHPFFELCGEFSRLVQAFLRLVRLEFIRYLREKLPAAKHRRNVITFDDLLTRLHVSLRSSGGEALAESIGSRYGAALIDEFQDTDPVQWEIFHRVFGSGRHVLFLIGDPKQAIYGFRGADIFTYLEARAKAGAHFTLGTNWRSDKRLVKAANELFSRHSEPFVFPEISFVPVEAAEKPEGESELELSGTAIPPQPLQLICVSGEGGEEVKAAEARETIIEMMRGEINRLLTCGVKRKGRPLEPGDVAILVRTNREAESVREKLVRSGIPAVVRTDRSVLQTEEAEQMLRLLGAILEPHKNGLVKAALASPLFEFDASRIAGLDRKENENQWQEWASRFHSWQEMWNRDGFMRMFRTLMASQGVKGRLLAAIDGERMVTNYQHIAECLHAAEYGRKLTPSTLLRWLREQNERAEGDGDSHIIRLEKDEKAVQVVTIHRSKGLEYPVVFCPFNWTSVTPPGGRKDIVFHDADNGNRLTWDLREPPAGENREAFEREQIAEAVRLLYVAVTRARNRCYLFWAVARGSMKRGNSALAHIFACGAEGGDDTPLVAFNKLGESGCAQLHPGGDYSQDPLYTLPRPEAAGIEERSFDRKILQASLITSFSGLTARAHDEAPDRDAGIPAGVIPAEVPEEARDPAPSIFTFPKGAKAGNFFHSLLETLDFSRAEGLPDLVARHLRLFRFDAAFAPAIADQLRVLLRLPLPEGVQLSEVPMKDRLVEAPFYFPIRKISPADLAGVFAVTRLPSEFSKGLGRLAFHPADGYMTGFIDLVLRHGGRYYVVDWKSNWLGPTTGAYRGEALRQAMSGSLYYLQYHLYTLALHLHLASTLANYDYERHFGGALYIFIRGIDAAEPSSGVFYDRPELALIEKLAGKLMPPAAREAGELAEVTE